MKINELKPGDMFIDNYNNIFIIISINFGKINYWWMNSDSGDENITSYQLDNFLDYLNTNTFTKVTK